MSKVDAEKGTRLTLSLSCPQYHAKLTELAKKYQISQGEVFEVLLDVFNLEAHQAAMIAKRTDKVGRRTSIRAMIERDKAKRDVLKQQAVIVSG